MTAAYIADTDRLGLGRPDHEPLASESIDAIIEEIEALLARDHAYVAAGDVYFRVRSDPDYGALSRRELDAMDQGEGVEGAALKEDPLDFALWKAQKPGEDSAWDAPWGRGRPGWHIECSAMAEGLLGVGFDIHGGGLDLLFPHHENEAAQTRCARGGELARLWMHNGMLASTDGEKMSKSVGNIAPLHEVLDAYGRDAVILVLRGRALPPADRLRRRSSWPRPRAGVARHPRGRPPAWPPGESPAALRRLRERFFAALAEDFNTPAALAAMWEWVREANRSGAGRGRRRRSARDARRARRSRTCSTSPDAPAGGIVELATARAQRARAAGDFARADELRAQIEARGWIGARHARRLRARPRWP